MSAVQFRNPIEALIEQCPGVHTAIHVGAGRGNLLPKLQNLNVSQVFHIEPVVTLTQHIKTSDYNFTLEIINRGILDSNNSQTFYEANNANYNGFTKPESLRDLFPESITVAESTLIGWPLRECIEETQAINASNLLIIDVPDICRELIESLTADSTKHLNWLIGTYYADELALQGIHHHLTELGFWCSSIPTSAGIINFSAYNIRQQLAPLQSELANKNQNLVKVGEELKQFALTNKNLNAEVATNKSLNDALQAQNTKLEEQAKAREQKLVELQSQLGTFESTVADLKANLTQAESAQSSYTAQISELNAQSEIANKNLNNVQLQKEKAEQALQELKETNNALEQTLASLQQEHSNLTSEMQNHEQTVAELSRKIESSAENTEENLGELKQQLELANSGNTELQAQLENLERQLTEQKKVEKETNHRQSLLDLELNKAEAQLSLLRDVLVRERL